MLAGAQLEVQETGPLVVCHQVLQQDEVWRGCGSRNCLRVSVVLCCVVLCCVCVCVCVCVERERERKGGGGREILTKATV